MYLFLILLIPLMWFAAARFWFHMTITWPEAIISVMLTAALTSVVYFVSVHQSISDTATINGEVTSKTRDKVGCRHSYPCRCRTVRCGKRGSCTRCDTCYVHGYDVDWNVHSNVGDVCITHIDDQGLQEPPRWTAVNKGDPFVRTESYSNYIKAAPDSLFNRVVANKYLPKVPEYPQAIFDYYKLNRFVTVDATVANAAEWNAGISDVAKVVGVQRQANVIVVLTSIDDSNFAEAVAFKWLGGKKNDIVVVIGSHDVNTTKTYPTIDWVRVLTYSKSSMFQVVLQDTLFQQRQLVVAPVLDTIKSVTMQHYQRKSFEEFKYLENEADPPLWVLIIALVTCIITTLGLTKLAHDHDWF